jgi:hypothetical protein
VDLESSLSGVDVLGTRSSKNPALKAAQSWISHRPAHEEVDHLQPQEILHLDKVDTVEVL